MASDSATKLCTQQSIKAYVDASASTYDDNKIQSNIALLGFKIAVNGSLAKYNLQDQIIDEYEDASGIDAGNSTNENLSSGVYNGQTTVTPTITQDADSTAVDGDYTYYKWTDTASTGSYSTDTTQAHEVLVVAGGGSGGGSQASYGSGGGGAGGYRTASALSLVGSTSYTITVGAGGAATATGDNIGVTGSNSSISGSDITDITSAGGGGGGSASTGSNSGLDGGSGGGDGTYYGTGDAGSGNTPSTTPSQGNDGGTTTGAGGYGSGGGGSGGAAPDGGGGSAGGAGTVNDITGASVTYAAGGAAGNYQPGGAGTANTGNGGQGAGQAYGGGAGGSGVVILRRLTSTTSSGADLTLQSTDTTAMAEPDYADMVILMENAEGTATINTDIKGYISKDSGSTFTEGTLVDEGTWGTNKKIYAFHDLDISAQSGTSMCYKITTHNQSEGSKETKIHATSIGWKA
jgi:hypothetical protein